MERVRLRQDCRPPTTDRVRLERPANARVRRFRAEWEGAVEGWAVKHIHRNLWRVGRECDFDDLYQDAYMYFLIVKERYPEVNTPSHFMSLFKRCLMNHFHALSNTRTRRAEVPLGDTSGDGDGDGLLALLGQEDAELAGADVRLTMELAPEVLRRVVSAATNPNRPAYMRDDGGQRQTTNEYLCALAGVGPNEYDFVGWLKSWLEE